ncbi:unnamed protein product [Clonostachys chloroleuca]|uniref:E3 ubiquitin-protein ligase MARCH5 n=1 Tax=Clonostachys chloroleuca TaxID=1926264 RepID=A0AA35LZB6_9HYPO|nr:unnamed protein product [Clonostachys chloroleuca]
MDPGSTSTRPPTDEPASAPNAVAAATSPRALDAPRRCFICLNDEEPTDPPSSWVDPCPCTLEAHQDCMLSWVVDCERSNKPLQCPVCKSAISMEGPWDPVVSFHDAVLRRFTRASPFLLVTGLSLGVQVSSQMYGAMAMWLFSGKDALIDYMLGGPNQPFGGVSSHSSKMERITNAAVLMNIAPALLIGQLIPGLGNKIFVPMGSLYGIYHVMNDDEFFTWPPSPQLAIAVFPYVRSIYYNLWREFVFPYEVNLNRRILGLPPAEPRRNDRGRENGRNGERNAEGGVVGFLQTLLDALDPDEEEQEGREAPPQIEIVHEEIPQEAIAEAEEQVIFEFHYEGDLGEDDILLPDEDEPAEALEDAHNDPPAPNQAEPAEQQAADQEQAANHREAAQAPPAHRPGLGTILSNMSNALVSALILPGISFAVGEALRLLLPKAWTTTLRPGLLQHQWGRSLIGGCLFVVIKDVVRLYSKHRKVAAMSNRRVKNVDRRRRGK